MNQKGVRNPHTFSLLPTYIISIRSARPDSFSNFIFRADSLGYLESRKEGGLDRISQNRGMETSTPGWANRSFPGLASILALFPALNSPRKDVRERERGLGG
jgi:hypothetical protein